MKLGDVKGARDPTLGSPTYEAKKLEARKVVRVARKQLQALKEEILQEFDAVFVDELGEEDRIAGDPIKLEVVDEKVSPYHCWSPASVSAHHEKEARRMVEAKVKSGRYRGQQTGVRGASS